ncbi:MAG: EamA family transporter [Dehalococcoidia bacterium]
MITAILFALLAATGWGSSAIFTRKGLEHLPTAIGTIVSLIASFIVLASAAILVYGFQSFSIPMIMFYILIFIGIVNYPIGRYMNFTSVRLAGVSRSSPLLASAPLVSSGLAIIFTNEQLNIYLGIGTLLIVSGIILVVSERR